MCPLRLPTLAPPPKIKHRAGQDADSPLVFKRTPTALQKMPCQRQDSSQRCARPACMHACPGAGHTAPSDAPIAPAATRRFQNWVQSTSPYAGRKTPPTASMKSCAAGGGLDENTPPVRAAADEQGAQTRVDAVCCGGTRVD
jgi:hypothetical protein